MKNILFLGRIHPKKGILQLIIAFHQLVNENKDLNLTLVIAGWDDGNHLSTLKNYVNSNNVNENIKFIGPVFGDDKELIFRNSDAFILPSFSEGLPMSVLEALSYGIPTLITRECNFTDIFEKGAALEIRPTVDSIFDNLKLLVTYDEVQISKLSQNGYEYVSYNFSWNQISLKMADLYQWISSKGNENPNFIDYAQKNKS